MNTAARGMMVGITLLLEAYGYRWYRVGGLDYLLKRSEIDGQPEFGSRRRAASR